MIGKRFQASANDETCLKHKTSLPVACALDYGLRLRLWPVYWIMDGVLDYVRWLSHRIRLR
jgi:hypothetical protein